MKRLAAVALVARIVLGEAVSAQQASPELARALDLERRGSYAAAADAYKTVLATQPADPAAVLGLERSLQPLNRLVEVIAAARIALSAKPTLFAAHSALVRSFASLGPPDSVRAAVERWARAAPGDESPYREWANGAISRGDRAGARAAVILARQRLGRAAALAPEAAQVASAEQDWPLACREWLASVQQVPGYRFTALAALTPAPADQRPAISRELQRGGQPEGVMLAAALTARWGDPVSGVRMLLGALSGDTVRAVERLNQFVEQMQAGMPGAEARRAEGMAFEAIAARVAGSEATRARALAARAYAEAGDRDGARRMLAAVDERSAGGASGDVRNIGISVLIADGNVDEASRRLAAARSTMASDEFALLNRRLAWGLARTGRLEQAEQALASDSTVDGFAVAGRVALLRGHVKDAADRLRAAGPYAGTREDAASRASLLSLLQQLEADTLPALGRALLQLERGDTSGATAGLARVATALAPDKGGAELRLWAGRIELARGRAAEAERLFRAAAVESAPATAPAAELELGRLLISVGRRDEGARVLEHMIVTYASSALVPQARRALDEARGAIPRT